MNTQLNTNLFIRFSLALALALTIWSPSRRDPPSLRREKT